MRAAAAALLLVGAYLVATERGSVATGYTVGAAVVVVVLSLRAVAVRLPPPPTPAPPLFRVRPQRGDRRPPRPAALLEWEAVLLAARLHGPGDRALGLRLAPLVEARLRERRGLEPGDPRAVELLGPAWARLRPGALHAGGEPPPSLDDLDDLTRRLEAL